MESYMYFLHVLVYFFNHFIGCVIGKIHHYMLEKS